MHHPDRFTLPWQREDHRRAPPVSCSHGAFEWRKPQHTRVHSTGQARGRSPADGRNRDTGPSPTSAVRCAGQFQASLCLGTMGDFLPGWGCLDKGKWTLLALVTTRMLALQPRPQHRGRFQGDRAACSGRLTFVPNTQLSPQVNQDYNHNSKDRIVLFFSFFFLKEWGHGKYSTPTKQNAKKKKNTKK